MKKTIKAYKGFNHDLTCRGFQYEVGKEYDQKCPVSACNSGFHACENPLDVFEFYPPCDENGTARYCEVEQSGILDCQINKSASSHIKIVSEIGLDGMPGKKKPTGFFLMNTIRFWVCLP